MNIELIFKNHKSIPLFDVEISQEEGSFARAKMLIAAGTPLPPTGTEAIIQGKTTLFRGSLIELPVKVDGNFAEIECIAIPVSLHEDVQRIQNESRISPYWDMLYVSDLTSETEIQDAHTSSLYYDRRGGVLTRSDWFEGRHTLDISHDFFKDSLVLRIVRSPLLSCTLNIHAYWVQQEEGVENLSSSIRFSFPRGKVSTYTKNAIVEKWPHIGKRVGKSGVWVLMEE